MTNIINRRGQGISINMVIIAAIALLVLIIAAIMITKSGANLDKNAGTKSCLANGGVCSTGTQCQEGYTSITGACSDTTQICCRYSFTG